MSSFYGGGGGGGLTPKDYNSLAHVPVKNIGGEGQGVVNLATLETGHYNLQGKYKISSDSSIEIDNVSDLDVLVLKDTVRSSHVVEFMTVDDGEVFFNVLSYDQDDNLIGQQKYSLTAPSHSSWGDIT